MVSHSLCTQLGFTLEHLKELRRYVGFSFRDEHNLEQIRQLIGAHLGQMVERFYAHIRGFESLRPFLDDEEATERLKQTLRDYILTLGKDTKRLAYAEQRLRIGLTHERIGLSPRWYLGIYPLLFEWIASTVASTFLPGLGLKLPSLLTSLHKAITLDSILAVEVYHHASTQRLEQIVEGQRSSQERLRREVQLDGLTQILNKQAVMTALEAEFLQCKQQKLPFTLLILDVDRFKRINDEHGHSFGDFVLKRVVDMVKASLRPGDIVGRFGGDEIIVGLGGCSAKEAEMIAERVRLKVVRVPFQHRDQRARVTLSIGVATATRSTESLEHLIDEADNALYRAKQAGRNRTCFSDGPVSPAGFESAQS